MAGLAVSERSPFMTVSQLRCRQLADSCILCVGSTGSGKGGDIELLLVLVALHYIHMYTLIFLDLINPVCPMSCQSSTISIVTGMTTDLSEVTVRAAGQQIATSDSAVSVTSQCELYSDLLGGGAAWLDTVGWEDRKKDDSESFKEILRSSHMRSRHT